MMDGKIAMTPAVQNASIGFLTKKRRKINGNIWLKNIHTIFHMLTTQCPKKMIMVMLLSS